MKRFRLLLLVSCFASLVVTTARAQWMTVSYDLQDGWNAIYLPGDASYQTPSQLFADHPAVIEVWRWNPNPDQIQFSTNPSVPDASSAEWTVWRRDDVNEQQLSAMIGQSSYLIKCEGGTSVSITQKMTPPAATWLVTGANFLGFPANRASGNATFASYFATFPVATTFLAKIYKYVSGPLGAGNPIEVTSTANEQVKGDSDALYASLLRIQDSAKLTDVHLPVSAQTATTAGL